MGKGPRKYTDHQLESAVAGSRNMRQLLMALGLSPRGGNYETVWRRIAALGLDASHLRKTFLRGRSVLLCSEREIIDAVKVSRSYSQVLGKLGIRPGGNQDRLGERIKDLGIDTSHFTGQGWRKGTRIPTSPARPLEELLVIGGLTGTSGLKIRLIEEGLKQAICEMCGRCRWNGRPIPLELDHINGRRDDNRLGNLRVLCPNCHAQTPTYRGRNIGGAEPLC
jgi:hypothetical protein